ncbi:MAG: primosomal protein N' [Thiothrix sp.]|nr:primosomal protein N' [Thiothrix sp.]HPQ94712.1 primosomal protein N' [Thiolinea sp.]
MKTSLLVAIPRPLPTLFSYLPPPGMPEVVPGMRVQVPLGHGSSVGLVVATATDPEPGAYVLKPVRRVLDTEPLLDEKQLALLQWAAGYYQHPPGEVFFSALPTRLRSDRMLSEPAYWRALPHPQQHEQLARAPRQQALHTWMLEQGQALSADALRLQVGDGWRSYLQGLLDKALAVQTAAPLPDPEGPAAPEVQSSIVLSTEQQDCLAQCLAWCRQEQPRPILLQGVTGSGKTEIYLRLIRELLAAGRQVLVLVPEIGLTPQLVQRFHHFFPGIALSCLHSGLNDGERLQAWQDARAGRARILIGTRSAVFLPCPALGLIVVDEEHDLSFKQQEGFRYHGRDLAIMRAHQLGIPILLGTATPALETLHNADQGRYHHTRLQQRPGASRVPVREVQDIQGQPLKAGLSGPSLEAIRATLARREQAMVFINRRGFAPVLTCRSCGWQARCPNCSAYMTYHARAGRLLCHHCLSGRAADSCCPDCGHQQLGTHGQGTERIEMMLAQQFPKTRVLRIDRDTTSRRHALAEHLEVIHGTDSLILVGTQMLAKGHDFPRLTLVVVLDVDQALFSSEYHALERFGQLLTQVAGRAGRAERPGRVILQTSQPHHPMLLALLQQGYIRFAHQLLEARQRWHFPPFGFQALIRADARDADTALESLQQFYEQLAAAAIPGTRLLGPAPAPLEKRAGRFRAQLLIQCQTRTQRHQCLLLLAGGGKKRQNKKDLRWSIDVDPVELS